MYIQLFNSHFIGKDHRIMKKQRITVCLLCAFMLLPLYTSCTSDQTEDNKQTADTVIDTVEETETEPEIDPFDPGLPARDFGGEDFIFATRDTETDYNWDIDDVEVDGLNGDSLNDAIYKRTVYIEDTYNVNIASLPCGNTGIDGAAKIITAAIMSNDSSAFQAILDAIYETAEFALKDFLVDMNTIEHLDLSKPWWDQNAKNELSFGGKLFFTTGELTVLDNEAVSILLFDKSLVDQYNLDSPYEDVLNGKWTMDKMLQNCEAVTSDLNGDGKMNEDDRFGYIYWQDAWIVFIHSMGNSIGELGEDGLPRQTMQTERLIDSWMRMNTLQNNGTAFARKTDVDLLVSEPGKVQMYMMERNNALYVYETVSGILFSRDLETDFGVIPYPKFDENQQNYHCSVSSWGCAALSVPVTNPDTEKTGFLLEAYCAKSAELLTPAYYDVSLTRKGVRDEDSVQMLEIIFDNMKYDIGYIYNWGDISTTMMNLFNAKKDTIASTVEGNIARVEKAIQTHIGLMQREVQE